MGTNSLKPFILGTKMVNLHPYAKHMFCRVPQMLLTAKLCWTQSWFFRQNRQIQGGEKRTCIAKKCESD